MPKTADEKTLPYTRASVQETELDMKVAFCDCACLRLPIATTRFRAWRRLTVEAEQTFTLPIAGSSRRQEVLRAHRC